MRRLVISVLALLFALLPMRLGHAARDIAPTAKAASVYELVVFEADGCTICEMFRRDIVPLYSESDAGRAAPIRFINLTWADESKMGLAEAITIAPTVVLFHEGREVDRIVGYTAPGEFVHLVAHMLGRPEE